MSMAENNNKKGGLKKLLIVLVIIALIALLFSIFYESKPVELPEESSSSEESSSQYEIPAFDDPLVDMDLPVGKLLVTDGRNNYDGEMLLVVPKLNLEETKVQNGTDDETLKAGPGLYEYAQMPWEKEGNVSIAGHRDIYGSHFYFIDKLEAGDMFYLVAGGNVYSYLYESTEIVQPDNWDPIRTQGYSCLTLTSCDPIGTTANRIIVQARFVGVEKHSEDYVYEPVGAGAETPEQNPSSVEVSSEEQIVASGENLTDEEEIGDLPAGAQGPDETPTTSSEVQTAQTAALHQPPAGEPEADDHLAEISQAEVRVLAATTTMVRLPQASGTVVYSEANVTVDASNLSEGYVMVKYTGTTTKKLKLRLVKGGTTYTYDLASNGAYQSFILSEGSGDYTLQAFQQISGDNYALLMSKNLNVQLSNGLLPFLYPNAYIPYQNSSNCIAAGTQLAANKNSELEVVQAIYQYAVSNITYDYDKASNVKSGYITEPDTTIAARKGICLDYAGVMTCMLRTQGIPTKLVVGYAGDIYHAWISTYIKDIGWVDGIIYFDGQSWRLMDPTFASSGGGNQEIINFITNTANYKKVYVY